MMTRRNPAIVQSLSSFLNTREPGNFDTYLADSLAGKAADSRQANARFFESQGEALITAAKALADLFSAGGRLFAMGNGGPGCDAARITVDFLHPNVKERPPLPVVNLGSNPAFIMAVGNDIGFGQVYARQITALGRAGDGLIGFSTDGNSTNLLTAFVAAKRRGLRTFGFSGGEGGRMKTRGLLDHCLIAPTTSIHRIQECHLTACHALSDLVHLVLATRHGIAVDADP